MLNTAGPSLHASCLRHCAESGLVVSTVEAAMPSDRFGFLLGTLYALWVRLTRLVGQVRTPSRPEGGSGLGRVWPPRVGG